jgi:hypothetical protein
VNEIAMRRIAPVLAMLTTAAGLLVVAPKISEAQVSARQRVDQRPLVPRAQARREADRSSAQVYVPGHWAWDRRRNQYSWVAGRWERYDRKHAFVGAGWTFRNGQWTFGPSR